MRLSRLNALAGIVLAAVLSAPAFGANPALPGTLNYIEGQAKIGDQLLSTKSVGSAQLSAGETLNTENGKAEVLLTPGVFARIGQNSSAKMVSPSITDTEIRLDKGQMLVEVDDIHKQNRLQVQTANATTTLTKNGLYEFDADSNQLHVFDGKATVVAGDQHADVKGGRFVALNDTGKLKAEKFGKKKSESSDLYRFSSLRSEYLAEANANAARTVNVNGGWGPGWYWDPFFSTYTFFPYRGYLYSPFGWGFYSPGWAYSYGVPMYYHYRVPGRWNGPAVGRVNPGIRTAPVPRANAGAFRGGIGGGFHGGAAGFHGGGLHR